MWFEKGMGWNGARGPSRRLHLRCCVAWKRKSNGWAPGLRFEIWSERSSWPCRYNPVTDPLLRGARQTREFCLMRRMGAGSIRGAVPVSAHPRLSMGSEG